MGPLYVAARCLRKADDKAPAAEISAPGFGLCFSDHIVYNISLSRTVVCHFKVLSCVILDYFRLHDTRSHRGFLVIILHHTIVVALFAHPGAVGTIVVALFAHPGAVGTIERNCLCVQCYGILWVGGYYV